MTRGGAYDHDKATCKTFTEEVQEHCKGRVVSAMEEADRLITFLNVFDLMIFDDLGRALPKERLTEVMPKFKKVAVILQTIAIHLDKIHHYTCVTAGTNPREIIFERGLNHENI